MWLESQAINEQSYLEWASIINDWMEVVPAYRTNRAFRWSKDADDAAVTFDIQKFKKIQNEVEVSLLLLLLDDRWAHSPVVKCEQRRKVYDEVSVPKKDEHISLDLPRQKAILEPVSMEERLSPKIFRKLAQQQKRGHGHVSKAPLPVFWLVHCSQEHSLVMSWYQYPCGHNVQEALLVNFPLLCGILFVERHYRKEKNVTRRRRCNWWQTTSDPILSFTNNT